MPNGRLSPTMAAANMIQRLGASRFNVDLAQKDKQKEFAKKGALAQFILSDLVPRIDKGDITETQAMGEIFKEGARLGVDTREATSLTENIFDNAAKMARLNNQSPQEYWRTYNLRASAALKQQQIPIRQQRAEIAAQKAGREMFEQTGLGAVEAAARKNMPTAISAVDQIRGFAVDIPAKYGKASLAEITDEQLIDELGDIGEFNDRFNVEGPLGGNIVKTRSQLARKIARRIKQEDPKLAAFGEDELGRAIEIVLNGGEVGSAIGSAFEFATLGGQQTTEPMGVGLEEDEFNRLIGFGEQNELGR